MTNTIDYSNDVKSPETIKLEVRDIIKSEAGDTETILGITADGTQLALYMLAEMIDAISTSTTIDDLKLKLQPRLTLAQKYLAEVADGSVVPTFTVKGVDTVVSDIKTTSTKVSGVLAAV